MEDVGAATHRTSSRNRVHISGFACLLQQAVEVKNPNMLETLVQKRIDTQQADEVKKPKFVKEVRPETHRHS